MTEILNEIDKEIVKTGEIENYINGNLIAYGVSIGLNKAKEIIQSSQKDACKYCKGQKTTGTVDDKSYLSIHGNELQFNLFARDTMYEKYYTINFCPMCGRELN